MSDIVLTARNISKFYNNGAKEVKAVDGVSLEIKKGKSLAIVGPSGAGKSTLLTILGGLDKPTSGEIALEGVDIYKLADRQRAKIRNRRVGFVFQSYHLLPEFTAIENVMLPALMKSCAIRLPCRQAGNTRYAIQTRAKEMLKAVGLEDRMGHKPSELSGGESQRVAIARALVNDPEILFCDEPTGNLDSKTSQSIYELLFTIKSQSNTAIVVVTHDEFISARADEAVHIRDGKVV